VSRLWIGAGAERAGEATVLSLLNVLDIGSCFARRDLRQPRRKARDRDAESAEAGSQEVVTRLASSAAVSS
jgi:hypothetical protein